MYKVRLARFGCKDSPHYSIVVADSRAPRSTFKQKLGYYDPLLAKDNPKRLVVDHNLVKDYISKGAVPTKTVKRLLQI